MVATMMTSGMTMSSNKVEPLNMHGHANTWAEELLEVAKERDELRVEVARLRACTGEHVVSALQSLQEVTGSNNTDNPWLGVTAAVVLLEAEIERLRAALTRLVELGDDDGNAPDDAWKIAFEHARSLCQT